MRLLVTRPQKDSERFAHEVEPHGIICVVAPLLTIRFQPAKVDLTDVQALLFTSANGVRAFAHASPVPDLPVLAVGDTTADAARRAGFRDTRSAGGNVDDLAALVTRETDPANGALLHVAGTVVAGDLAGALATYGHEVRRIVLYHAETAATLPRNAREALATGKLDGAPFFSPRSAHTFVSLVDSAGLGTTCIGLTAYCLSEAVAESLRSGPGVRWGRIEVADAPDQAALVELILRTRTSG